MLVKGDAATQPAAVANMPSALAALENEVSAANDKVSLVIRPAVGDDRLDLAEAEISAFYHRRQALPAAALHDLVNAILAPMPGNDYRQVARLHRQTRPPLSPPP